MGNQEISVSRDVLLYGSTFSSSPFGFSLTRVDLRHPPINFTLCEAKRGIMLLFRSFYKFGLKASV